MESPAGAETVINGRRYTYFCGCGYLGLQNHPEVIEAGARALEQYGLSTATSLGGYGNHPLYEELEKQACTFFNCERLLYFATGYLGASILVQADLHSSDHFFIDDSAHFSLWDAAALSNRPITPFSHCNPSSLENNLKNNLYPGERPILLTDGLFPISGEIAPLADYLDLIRRQHGRIIIDDAHAVGVLGENGRSSLEHFQITDSICQSTGTFNKALGGFGGFIYGDAGTMNHIEKNSRILIGSSPPPLPAAASSAKALQVIREHPEFLKQLRINIQQAGKGFRSLGWNIEPGPSPIFCLSSSNRINLLSLRDELFKQGIAVEYVNNYTSAPAGGALRIALFASHNSFMIDKLISAMSKFMNNEFLNK